ncbi:nardilysin-like [Copidosoma floridanum]|uniref:nardilysin-like n=1 Tax=Copidosoma floridanum TaxID=29053 RepID=UPI000C6FC0FF|nr:nardilysin-like [Copidosoma floridanum]
MPKAKAHSAEESAKSVSSASEPTTNNDKKTFDVKIQLEAPDKSESDKKDYRAIRLPNGLTALLVSDLHCIGDSAGDSESESEEEDGDDGSQDDGSEGGEEEEEYDGENKANDCEDGDEKPTSKSYKKEKKLAACALSINVGSFSDPLKIQGMAHFLEHMVFMGSEKYPQENDFDEFIKKKGGSDNASTDCEHTTFYFEIQEKHLLPAMDRFAQFFINPLMKRSAITREREAIESEFKMALPSDFYRKEQLFCSCAKTNHPATKFSWGNLITLKDNIEEETLYSELHKFKDRHYSAHRMTLAVQARLSLDELEKYVIDCFSSVPVNHLSCDDFSEFKGKDSFNNPNFCKLYKVKPITETCQVELTWVMPPLHHLYKSKPHQVVSWLIGHEGEGSLINYLRKKLWCLDIFSGNSEGDFEHNSMYALFGTTLILTDDGCKHLREVLDALFSYINFLRRVGPSKRVFDEIQRVEEINFRFQDEQDPAEYVESLCVNMHLYPSKDFLTGENLYSLYDPESIKQCMEDLSPEKVNIILFDRKFNEEDFDQVEPWFQTKYSSEDIPKEWVSRWKEIEPFEEFHLPEPNEFITDDFTLIDLPADVPSYPTKIYHDEKTEIWYRMDPKFRLPECYIYLLLQTPYATESPKSSAMLDIYLSVLKYLVVPSLYPASAAELSYEIVSHEKGIVIKVYGFNQKLPLLLKKIFQNIVTCHDLTTEDLFNVMKREQCKEKFNTFIKPNKLCRDVRLSIITKGYSTAIEKHTALCDIDFHQYLQFAEHLMDNLYIQCLAQGNMTRENLLKCVFECTELLKFSKLDSSAYPQILAYEIPIGEKYCKVKSFLPNDVNSVVTNLYQFGLDSIHLSVMIQLLMLVMKEPAFDFLRTHMQLGYDVWCDIRETYDTLEFSISVCTQANKFSTDFVNFCIEHFIESMIKFVESMSQEKFDCIKKSLIETKMCVDVNLEEEVTRNWSEITKNKYIFDRNGKEIVVIESIKLSKLIQWFKDHLLEGKNFRKLSVHVVGTANPSTDDRKMYTGDNEGKEKEKYSLKFIPIEDGEEQHPLDDYITDIEAFKSQLKLMNKLP